MRMTSSHFQVCPAQGLNASPQVPHVGAETEKSLVQLQQACAVTSVQWLGYTGAERTCGVRAVGV